VDSLEGDLKDLLIGHRQALIDRSMDPDRRKDDEPEEFLRHFVNLDRYGQFPFAEFELDFRRTVQKWGEPKVTENGTLLWAAHRSFEALSQAFRNSDTEQILRHASDLSHYIADLHQPLHTTINYNGQLSGQLGIHFRFEVDLASRYIDRIQFTKMPAADLGDVLTSLHSMAVESFVWIDNILLADRQVVSQLGIERKEYLGGRPRKIYPEPYFEHLFQQLGSPLELRLNQAVHRLNSLWWMAWVKGTQSGR